MNTTICQEIAMSIVGVYIVSTIFVTIQHLYKKIKGS